MVFGWLLGRAIKAPEVNDNEVSFEFVAEEVTASDTVRSEVSELAYFLADLCNNHGFKKIDDFGTGWPKSARILLDIERNDEVDTFWIESHVDVGGEDWDKLQRPKILISYEYNDLSDLTLHAAKKRIAKLVPSYEV